MVYQIKLKNNSVSSTMFMKLTIKVVAFFLGHPVYKSYFTWLFYRKQKGITGFFLPHSLLAQPFLVQCFWVVRPQVLAGCHSPSCWHSHHFHHHHRHHYHVLGPCSHRSYQEKIIHTKTIRQKLHFITYYGALGLCHSQCSRTCFHLYHNTQQIHLLVYKDWSA